ncbi:hypothetical protein ACH5RR_032083 [Cinchona calisaya]|uniref:Uncharacterized protein n=1 Tax=Cinchona calisaya TaxID=153742 RepID=A0ABD2YIF8_9GENT
MNSLEQFSANYISLVLSNKLWFIYVPLAYHGEIGVQNCHCGKTYFDHLTVHVAEGKDYLLGEIEAYRQEMASENSSNSRTNNGARGNGGYVDSLMTQMVLAITCVTEVLKRQNRHGNGNLLGENGAPKHFLKFKPSEFIDELDDEKAKTWIEHMKSIFGILKCEDERKIAFAAFQLKGAACE